jgi:polyphosphate kinase
MSKETPISSVEDPRLFINRELSLLEFNRRVLEQARDPDVPLLERVRFMSISSSNLDEFFEVRVAGLKQQLAYGLPQTGADGLSPSEALRRIATTAHDLVRDQYAVLNDEIIPALEAEGVRMLRRHELNPKQARWVRDYFEEQVLPVLSPIGLDPAHPFPRILNKALNFVVTMRGVDAFGRQSGVAVVRVPRSLPRLIRIPPDIGKRPHELVLLSSVIHANVDRIFPGMNVTGCYQFRVTRNSDLWVDEEEVEDLLSALKDELLGRHYGDAVRLEVADTCTKEMELFLLEQFELEPHELYRVNGPVNLHRLMALPDLVSRPDLRYRPFLPRGLGRGGGDGDLADVTQLDIFDQLKRRDMLLHHPFESFTPIIELLRAAAEDPNVVAIKQTLYRTGEDSEIAQLLAHAAQSGKEVAVVIELKARFDEAANIKLATELQDAGVNVVYGLVGHKTHCKMLLIVRRENDELVRYAHLGTGNYHQGTARAYTDVGLLTTDEDITSDVQDLFKLLTGLGRVPELRKLLHAPFTLAPSFLQLIAEEAERAKSRGPDDPQPRIIAKMNSLTEPKIIQALYQASRAGVKIDLIVRGICCLRPGVPGVSENISVRSIVGRFLEHSRVFYFSAGGEGRTYIGSADWMDRNFFRRAEVCTPVEDSRLRERLFEEVFTTYLEDNVQAWVLDPSGEYRRLKPGPGEVPSAAQTRLLS